MKVSKEIRQEFLSRLDDLERELVTLRRDFRAILGPTTANPGRPGKMSEQERAAYDDKRAAKMRAKKKVEPGHGGVSSRAVKRRLQREAEEHD